MMNSFGMQLPICLIWTPASLRKLSRFLLCQGTCLFKHIELPSLPVFTKQAALLSGEEREGEVGGCISQRQELQKEGCQPLRGRPFNSISALEQNKKQGSFNASLPEEIPGWLKLCCCSKLRLRVYRWGSGRVRRKKKHSIWIKC